MGSSKTKFQLVVLAFILSLAGAAFAQDGSTVQPQTPDATANTRAVPEGRRLKSDGDEAKVLRRRAPGTVGERPGRRN